MSAKVYQITTDRMFVKYYSIPCSSNKITLQDIHKWSSISMYFLGQSTGHPLIVPIEG